MALWEVGSGKTYSTIVGALNALYGAVTTTPFTETQTIRVYDGTYSELVAPDSRLVPTATYRLIIEAASGNLPIVNGGGTRPYGIQLEVSDYVTVSGFKITNATMAGIRTFGDANCIFTGNTCYSTVNGISLEGSSNSCTVIGNICYSNSNAGISVVNSTQCILNGNFCYSNNYGISTEGQNTNIYNNIILNSTTYGIRFESATNSVLYNNTLYNNPRGIRLWANQGLTVKNNVIYALSGQYCIAVDEDTSKTGFASDFNLLYAPSGKVGNWGSTGDQTTLANWRSATSGDANSVSAAPQFFDSRSTFAKDFTPVTHGNAYGIGADLSGTFTTDFNGTTRTTPWSAGAFIPFTRATRGN